MENDRGEEQLSKYLMPFFMVLSIVGLIVVFKRQIGAAFINALSKRVHARIIHQKNALFKPLCDESRPLNILEIGSGSGMNFKYYPEGTILTCLEPNPHQEKYLRENLARNNQKIKLKEYVCGYAEDLSRFQDGQFDAVVETLVLCSVRSTEAVLQEVKRVLKPGGTFYFIDHVAGHGHSHGVHEPHKSTQSSETEDKSHGASLTHRFHTTHGSQTAHTTHESHDDAANQPDQGCVTWFFTLFHRIFHIFVRKNFDTISRNREIAKAIENAKFAQMETTNFKTQLMPFWPWKSDCIYGRAKI